METNLLFVDDTRQRAALVRLQETTDKLNEIFAANILIQPGYFLSENEIEDNISSYRFITKQTEIDNAVFPLSHGVDDNDVFIGIEAELTVDNRSATTSPLVTPQTYNNIFHFTAANTGTPAHITCIFNSVWSYQVGATTYIQNQTTRKFFRIPATQQSAANNNSLYTGNRLVDQDGYIVISGKATTKLMLDLNTPAAFAGAGIGGTVNILSFLMYGFTLQNGAGFANFYTGGISLAPYELKYANKNKGIERAKWETLEMENSFGNMK